MYKYGTFYLYFVCIKVYGLTEDEYLYESIIMSHKIRKKCIH